MFRKTFKATFIPLLLTSCTPVQKIEYVYPDISPISVPEPPYLKPCKLQPTNQDGLIAGYTKEGFICETSNKAQVFLYIDTLKSLIQIKNQEFNSYKEKK